MQKEAIKEICDQILPEANKFRGMKRCPNCHNKIDEREFRTSLDLQEFKISGLCQICQDKVFGE